jgi:PAS domain S-box-containing protein
MVSGRDILNRAIKIFNTLSFKLIFWVGLILLVSISLWLIFDIRFREKEAISDIAAEANRFGNTIKLGTHYAMMLNSRDDINQIIQGISRQKEIETIRIYNKAGQIKFSNHVEEIDYVTNIKAEACDICHRSDPPLETLSLMGRTRIFDSSKGYRLLGIISPIYNEPGCASDACHVHPENKKVLGALDVVTSLENKDKEIRSHEKKVVGLTLLIFIGASGVISIFLLQFVNRPIKKLIRWTEHIGRGKYDYEEDIAREDEIGQLAESISQMGKSIGEKQDELNKQKEEYQTIFELVPCYVTVQGRDLKLIQFNRNFAKQFDPTPGDYCYHAYKNRSKPCEICPVMKTFEDGDSHVSEEAGINKDGSLSYWLVQTAPIKNKDGDVIAAMEMCTDLTHVKFLEEEVKKTEEKYQNIFNTIPLPIFVVDRDTLQILDCNNSVTPIYGFKTHELLDTPFLNFFVKDEQTNYSSQLKSSKVLNQVKHLRKDGNTIYVNIRVSNTIYQGQQALLVTTSDITKRLMAEQQLIQASKMATLGEMATGVAHELNQPLSVIKTASSFLLKKVQKKEKIKDGILETLTEEVDSHVDRASKIINHMREFGRKSEVVKDKVHVNDALNRALEIFSQQLMLREINVVKNLEPSLPPILADTNRLEQIFINLLINARDAIEEKWERGDHPEDRKEIYLKTSMVDGNIAVEVKDTGAGIPKKIRDKIFEPFFTSKKVGQGTGLGLSISYGIVQDYNGTIRVETTEGKGSSFIIHFPVEDKG